MSLLPWLLRWPRRPVSLGVFLLLVAFSVGTLAAFGGLTGELASENVTVESADVTVRLNDETQFPDAGNGTVQTCLATGTPGDSIGVLGDVTLDVPRDRDTGEDPLTVVVSLAHTEETTTATVEETGRVTSDVFWVLADDETLSVGDTARLQVDVRSDGSTVASTTETVVVGNGSRSYDC
ncbi:hypothetical protein [Haloarchaeobius sp. HRN-SO-5]|uniref:hypothetical protein n=1 Tax=Haloarchaeobius sp. HRN-SO-5 TaxID=3446118 RepID=UPI003EC121DB